ncbi:MAG: hypothetical protein GWN30_27520, partial [Gammaproteobacteria bacterium]|nr:hypothetical protein [Gammaproteobacteria bacterium]
MAREISGVGPSARVWEQITNIPPGMTPLEKADYAAGIVANTLETALA